MNINEFVQEHGGRNLCTFMPGRIGHELPEIGPWLENRSADTLQIARSTGLVLPSAEEILESQGGAKGIEESLQPSWRVAVTDQVILFACSSQPQSVPEIKRYAELVGVNPRNVWKETANLEKRDQLVTRERVVYLEKDRPRGLIRVLTDLSGYQTRRS